jgi:hypothetical protein
MSCALLWPRRRCSAAYPREPAVGPSSLERLSPSSVTVYFIPVVAIALGVIFLDESVALASVIGTGLAITGRISRAAETSARAGSVT